jgi:hypothetical protein
LLSGKVTIAAARHDIRGQGNHPLNLQFVGDSEQLAAQLLTQGWKIAEMLSWNNILRLLSPSTPLAELPVLPQVHDASHERLVLVKNLTQNKRIILRLWRAPVFIDSESRPLFVGNVSAQKAKKLFRLLVIPSTESDFSTPIEHLLKAIDSNERIGRHMVAGSVLLLMDQ